MIRGIKGQSLNHTSKWLATSRSRSMKHRTRSPSRSGSRLTTSCWRELMRRYADARLSAQQGIADTSRTSCEVEMGVD